MIVDKNDFVKRFYFFQTLDEMNQKYFKLLRYRNSISILYSGNNVPVVQDSMMQRGGDTYQIRCEGDYNWGWVIVTNEKPSLFPDDEKNIEQLDKFKGVVENVMKKISDGKEYTGVPAKDVQPEVNVDIKKSRKPWSDEEIAVLNEGSAADVAKHLGRSIAAVNWQRFAQRKKSRDVLPDFKWDPPVTGIVTFPSEESVQNYGSSTKDLISYGGQEPITREAFDEDDYVLKISYGEQVLKFNKMPKKLSIFGIEIEF